jgi:predicted O-methyltransferase YrrM
MPSLRTIVRHARRGVLDSHPLCSVVAHRRGEQVDEALEQGLTRRLEPALRYLVHRKLDTADQAVVDRVEALRKAAPGLTGFGSTADASGKPMSLRYAAGTASITPLWGTVLYLAAKESRASAVLELGSNIGIGTSYLASAGPQLLVSGEGSASLAAVARFNACQIKPDTKIIEGLFADSLDEMISQFPDGIDFAWLDGHHHRDATLDYFERLRPSLLAGAVVFFDDIRWSYGMREAWARLSRAEGFTHTVDLDRLGVGCWDGGAVKPVICDLRGLFTYPRARPRA